MVLADSLIVIADPVLIQQELEQAIQLYGPVVTKQTKKADEKQKPNGKVASTSTPTPVVSIKSESLNKPTIHTKLDEDQKKKIMVCVVVGVVGVGVGVGVLNVEQQLQHQNGNQHKYRRQSKVHRHWKRLNDWKKCWLVQFRLTCEHIKM